MKLNLGCGENKYQGFINVDKFGTPDLKCDLEKFPWPWKDNSVDEIRLIHVLEHLGKDIDIYFNIFKELYRISKDGTLITIFVPHFRHDFFFNDPTHVRVITPDSLLLFSKSFNKYCAKNKLSNSPLGLYLDIDFEIVSKNLKPGEAWFKLHPDENVDINAFIEESTYKNNLIEEFQIVIKAIKKYTSESND